MNTLPRIAVDRRAVPITVGIETANSRQSGANRDLFRADFAIPYQRQIDIRFIPIFPNAWVLKQEISANLALIAPRPIPAF